MKKPEKAVIQTTAYIGTFTVILTLLMHAVFLVAGYWSLNVLWSSLLGATAAVANFFLRGLTVQSAVTKEEKEARDLIRLSYTLRSAALVIVAVVGAAVPIFNIYAVLIPLLFPRIAILFFPLTQKRKEEEDS